jgi:hypothetical protein
VHRLLTTDPSLQAIASTRWGGTMSTTGTIATGQSQECNIANEITIIGGTIPGS